MIFIDDHVTSLTLIIGSEESSVLGNLQESHNSVSKIFKISPFHIVLCTFYVHFRSFSAKIRPQQSMHIFVFIYYHQLLFPILTRKKERKGNKDPSKIILKNLDIVFK